MLHSWVETPTPPNPNPPDPNPHWVSLYSVSQQYLLSSADNVYTSFSVSFELFKLVYMFNTVLNLYFEPLVSPTRDDKGFSEMFHKKPAAAAKRAFILEADNINSTDLSTFHHGALFKCAITVGTVFIKAWQLPTAQDRNY